MNVYAVIAGYWHEGEVLLGIFSTRHLAEQFQQKMNGHYHFTDIEEYEVDSEKSSSSS